MTAENGHDGENGVADSQDFLGEKSAATPAGAGAAAFPAWLDLSGRAKFRLTGPDRVRFLNGQVTNDVKKLQPGEACYALVCTHKGKLEADVFIRAEEECFLLDAPGELREPLWARLNKYLIADECEWEDVTDAFALWHELGAPAPEPGQRDGGIERLGVPGRDVWLPADKAAAGVPASGFLSEAEIECLRVERAVPRWGAELTPDTLPQEACLEGRAVDFYKGCYIGQEVVSRLKSVGRVNRLLRALEAVEEAESGALRAGDRLFAGDDLAETGWITSAVWHPRLRKTMALGYVKRAFADGTGLFQAGREKNALSSRMKCRDSAPD